MNLGGFKPPCTRITLPMSDNDNVSTENRVDIMYTFMYAVVLYNEIILSGQNTF